ncbi:MAG: acyl-CoA thioesterase [Myxococcota bacterium]
MSFEHRLTVRFFEVDRAGIAFFGRVFEYCHAAYEALLVALDYPLAQVFDNEGWGMPLVHAEADFKRPMRLGEELVIKVSVGRLGKTSIILDFAVYGADDGELRATAQHVHACVDMERFAPMEVPDRLRQAFKSLGDAAQ